jgi:ATP-dependent RNA helicase DeaD
VCVATDVAARGLDVPELGLVVHADIPRDGQTLLHRSGRTARAGRKGTCVLLVSRPARHRVEGLFASARIAASWSAPPTAEAIHQRDHERLLAEVTQLSDEAGEEGRSAARTLLAGQPAEVLAAALVRLYDQRLPEPARLPASLAITVEATSRKTRAPRDLGETIWFRLNVGRERNADPRWIIPLICRRGDVTKSDIGAIRILPRETRFEIAGVVAERFAAAARRPDAKEPGLRIEPSAPPRAAEQGRPAAGKKPPTRGSPPKHRKKPSPEGERGSRGKEPPRRKR